MSLNCQIFFNISPHWMEYGCYEAHNGRLFHPFLSWRLGCDDVAFRVDDVQVPTVLWDYFLFSGLPKESEMRVSFN